MKYIKSFNESHGHMDQDYKYRNSWEWNGVTIEQVNDRYMADIGDKHFESNRKLKVMQWIDDQLEASASAEQA